MSVQDLKSEDPEFISFLFSTELKHDFYFLVGNKDHIEPEKIGVVKTMLMAHSAVFRLELGDSELADKEQVALPDIYPDTFRNLLRYVYGHDTTASLNFNETDDLFYVAHKYMMSKLKNKLATKLMDLLNTENICSLLKNPAVFVELELDDIITNILRYETDKVLASPMFLEIGCSGLVKILEQDSLNVPEIELWRAALKWAKHNVDSEDGKELRRQMSTITQHIRICTLTTEQFCKEVVPTRVLSNYELAAVGIAIGKQEKQDELTEFSNEFIPRNLVDKMNKHDNLQFTNHKSIGLHTKKDFTFKVITKKFAIKLLPLECLALEKSQVTQEGETYPVGCFITITRDTDCTTLSRVTLGFYKEVVFGKTFKIPLISNGRNVILLPKSKYTIKMEFTKDQRMYYNTDLKPVLEMWEKCSLSSARYSNKHLTLNIPWYKSAPGLCYTPINHLAYQLNQVIVEPAEPEITPW